jgi:hypothetical protein
MDSEAPELVSHDFALSSVEARAQPDAERGSGVAYGACATHRTRGPVERTEEPVTRRVDLTAPKACKFAADARLLGL